MKEDAKDKYFAHTFPGRPAGEWQLLEDHLQNVADMARRFGEPFGAGDWGYVAGMLHDIGKYSDEFQDMLLRTADNEASSEYKRGPDHSSAGAQEINNRFTDGRGKLLAYPIASHHSGLLDGISNDACLQKRLLKIVEDYSACPPVVLESVQELQLPPWLMEKAPSNEIYAFRLQLFIRMIFSSLVDADFLDTEEFRDGKKSVLRGAQASLQEMWTKVLQEIESIQRNAEENDLVDTPVNKKRREVLEQCLRMAEEAPGLFSLTVPTGGGKTLSSLAFALNHAIKYGKSRIIYVIPYTSIIEQNARVFRDACGNDAVLEHHSNFEFTEDTYAQLASENWDAPLIVTTNVQFFETLFHHRGSRCRKAHNIANSVVIFDEAQMLPIDLLRPCMAVIKELTRNYGVTAVLCSATQPALAKNDEFKDGIEGIREIISNPDDLYCSLRRVSVHKLPRLSDAEVASHIDENEQVLCVVNTRKHARRLYEATREKNGLYQLSGLMCPAHRSQVLERVRAALRNGEPCRVISTQLIEAGVDVDFPIVFRALSGIDSIAQAAGRCNREGKLQDGGSVYVFIPEDAPPPGYLRQTAEEAQSIIRNYDDILSLEAVHEYFRNVYWKQGDRLDKPDILGRLAEGIRTCDFPFRTIGEIFRLIEDGTQTIVIPFNGEARSLIREMKASDSRSIARKLQRFCVQVYPYVVAKLGRAAIEPLHERYYVLVNDDLYKSDIGLDWDDPYFRSIEGTMC